MKLLSLPTFFAAAKKVGAAPHRGRANRPTRKQGKANTIKNTDKKKANHKKTSPAAGEKSTTFKEYAP
ncbi:hypothetical protein LJ656_29080 [Paraburkholderia sp. MMS20-SJTR3]|uniref:Uncharacterized protein n=1 Tax=Paraburkholderia sejongensis TaxID=2886946 RepID=A0ABS8K3B4_9BURK|nr:hypothetical protein [Paraburkholderia sp. MMS20-SJTR3]MCC8396649.1 hypothetical protein [Paraburkholderia sp. MMS20-SJTR3]